MKKKDYLTLAPIIDLRSEWIGDSLMRATVRQYENRFVVEVMELTEKRTSKKRAADFALQVAQSQEGTLSAKHFLLNDAEIDRKGERLDGSKVLTRVRNTNFLFTTE